MKESERLSMLREIAQTLREAQFGGQPCAPPTALVPELGVADAYAIQRLNVAHRVECEGLWGRPARRVGYKIGLTSRAVQQWLGVYEPDFGELLDDMVVADGGTANLARLLQPRAEAEVAFVLGKPLKGPGLVAAQVMAATDFVLPAIEIVDSRIADWKISYVDTIADNASSGMLVLGNQPRRLSEVDLGLCGMALRKNGALASSGAGAACMGNPVNAVVWLANKLGEFGVGLEAGQVILSGALGPVVAVEKGDWLEAEIRGLGRVGVRFSREAVRSQLG